MAWDGRRRRRIRRIYRFMCISATIHFVSIAETNPQSTREASIGGGGGRRRRQRKCSAEEKRSNLDPASSLVSFCLPLPSPPFFPSSSSASHITAPLRARAKSEMEKGGGWTRQREREREVERQRGAAVARH